MLEAFAVSTGVVALGEMGDKTQVATVMLAMKYAQPLAVTLATTLGMLIANVPAVLLGERAVRALPRRWVNRAAAALFALLGIALLLGAG